jgi:folate-binding protein YgfZ
MTILIAHLSDRAIIEVRGEETRGFLQDLVTANVGNLQSGEAAHGGLLTPQGKILFDFFIVATPEGVLIDCEADAAATLAQRLTMYKLRRALAIEVLEPMAVAVAWGGSDLPQLEGAHVYADPRNPELGLRVIAAESVIKSIANQPADAYRAHRYKLGIADSAEIGSGEMFPHEANYDQFGSVDFKKGCYVGQEVVSRMQHRGTARSRIVPVKAGNDLPDAGAKIMAGGKPAGALIGTHATSGLAVIRLDRAAKADNYLSVDGLAITMQKPSWAKWVDMTAASGDDD